MLEAVSGDRCHIHEKINQPLDGVMGDEAVFADGGQS